MIPGLEDGEARTATSATLFVTLDRNSDLLTAGERSAARVLLQSPELVAGVPATIVAEIPGLNAFHFEYFDGSSFLVERDGSAVRGWWDDRSSLEDAATYLLGPIIAFVLRLRGLITVHSSAVAINGHAAMFVGRAGIGKSTTAAAFALAGYPVLTDDVAAVVPSESGMRVLPSYPRVRLWDDAVTGLLGSAEALPLLTPTWDKRYLPLNSAHGEFAEDPLPIAAMYLLRDREAEMSAPRIEPLSRLAAFPEVLGHLLTNRAIPGEPPEIDFRFSSMLVERVPTFSLTANADPARLPDLCRLVARHVADLVNATSVKT